jgi:hypothetical protein
MSAPHYLEQSQELDKAAVEFLEHDDRDGAAAVLAPAMTHLDPDDTAPTTVSVDAAITWSRTAVTAAQAGKRHAWADFARRHAPHVFDDPAGPRYLAATTVLADLHDLCGEHAEALPLRDVVAAGWHDLGDLTGVACTRALRASTLHCLGRCGDAVREITDTLARWRPHHDRAVQLSRDLVVKHVQLLVMCGRDDEAATCIVEHADLLPEPGSRARIKLALLVFARLDWDARGAGHAAVCGRRPPENLAGLFQLEAPRPWAQRRHRLRTLLTAAGSGAGAGMPSPRRGAVTPTATPDPGRPAMFATHVTSDLAGAVRRGPGPDAAC